MLEEAALESAVMIAGMRTRLSGGSDTAKIIRYGLRHWDGLTRFLDDARIELDANILKRSMRPQAHTRCGGDPDAAGRGDPGPCVRC
jgi:hypothetical protein